jgi:hypothetical protein
MTRAIGLHICFNEMELPRIVPIKQRYNHIRQKPISAAAF